MFLPKIAFRKTLLSRWVEIFVACYWCRWKVQDMTVRVVFFILKLVRKFLSDGESNTAWNREKSQCHKVLRVIGLPYNDMCFVMAAIFDFRLQSYESYLIILLYLLSLKTCQNCLFVTFDKSVPALGKYVNSELAVMAAILNTNFPQYGFGGLWTRV